MKEIYKKGTIAKGLLGEQCLTRRVDSDIPCVAFDKDRPSIMIQSSGTIGKPKIIVHFDFSATFCTKALTYCDLPMGEGKRYWLLFHLGLHMCLARR